MFQRLLVPLDGSLRAEQAIPIAARLARASQGMLVLAYTVPAAGPDTLAESELLQVRLRMQLDKAQQYLTALASSKELAGLSLETVTSPGPVVSAIVSAIHTYQPDLLVLCEQNSSHELQPFIGGLAGHLIEQIATPLLLIPAQGSYVLHQNHPMTLLVAGDGLQPESGLMRSAVALLAALAPGGQGRLRFVPLLSELPSPASSVPSKQAADNRASSKARSTAVSLQEIPVNKEAERAEYMNKGDLLVLGIPMQHKRSLGTLRENGYTFLSQRALPLFFIPLVGDGQP